MPRWALSYEVFPTESYRRAEQVLLETSVPTGRKGQLLGRTAGRVQTSDGVQDELVVV